MKHPLYTLDDGTEITASSIRDGKARIYVEKFDKEMDVFRSAMFSIPDGEICYFEHYTEDEVKAIVNRYLPLSREIMELIRQKGNLESSVYETEGHVELVEGEPDECVAGIRNAFFEGHGKI